METLKSAFQDIIKQVAGLWQAETVITEDNVYQEAVKDRLPFIDQMLDSLVLPGSGVKGMEHLRDLLGKADSGASCLLLLEHYSNFDLPLFSYLVRKEAEDGQKIDDALVAIAGMKLNEENPVVASFSCAYTRIVIYPSRSLHGLDAEKLPAEKARSVAINHAALRKLNEVKKQGKILLVFPSGTRYRPGEPDTKKGVREIDSYIKTFDYMCLVSINGEILHIRQGDMMEDSISADVVRITVDPVASCADFRRREREKAENAGVEDKKQAVVDAIMARLEAMHQENIF